MRDKEVTLTDTMKALRKSRGVRTMGSIEEDENEPEETWLEKFVLELKGQAGCIKDENSFYVNDQKCAYAKNSLHLLSNRNPFRIFLVKLITHWIFEKTILLLILVNSLCLGFKDYIDVNNETVKNQIIEKLEAYFTYAFIFECVVKIMA